MTTRPATRALPHDRCQSASRMKQLTSHRCHQSRVVACNGIVAHDSARQRAPGGASITATSNERSRTQRAAAGASWSIRAERAGPDRAVEMATELGIVLGDLLDRLAKAAVRGHPCALAGGTGASYLAVAPGRAR